jgi:uncharacterized protein
MNAAFHAPHAAAADPYRQERSAQGAPPSLCAELFTIPLDAGRYLIYAPLRRAAFVGNARVVNFLADLKSGKVDASADPHGTLTEFLRRLEIVDAPPEVAPIVQFSGTPEPTSVTLFLTTACNLRCTYCYASAGDTPARFMQIDVAKRGIDFVIGNAIRRGEPGIEVAFHGGGEPSVNWATMTSSWAYARQQTAAHGLELTGSCATNGILNSRQADWIIEHLDGASVSFDGLPQVHDQHRPTVAGGKSSDRVMATLRRFDLAGFPYGVRLTVTRDQIDRLPDSVEFICEQFRPLSILVEPSYQLGRWQDAPSAETAGFIEAFREAQGRAAQWNKEIRFSAARIETLTNHFCGVTQDSFCLSPDGNVSACYETFSEDNPRAKVFFYGTSAGDGYAFDADKLEHLRHQAVQHHAWCQGCFAKWHCAGDCYHKSLAVNGPGAFRGSDRCHIARALTLDQILERIHRSGGLFWHEAPHDGSNGSHGGHDGE